MKKAGIITEEYHDKPQLMLFQRAARTDKGVSAIRQVVSLKLRKCSSSFEDGLKLITSETRLSL